MSHEPKDYQVDLTLQDNKIVLSNTGPFYLGKGNKITLTPPPGGKVIDITIHCYSALGSWTGDTVRICGKVHGDQEPLYEIKTKGDQVVIRDLENPSGKKEEYWFEGHVEIEGRKKHFDPEIINKRGG